MAVGLPKNEEKNKEKKNKYFNMTTFETNIIFFLISLIFSIFCYFLYFFHSYIFEKINENKFLGFF
jgi:hypothetical protein